MKIGDKALIRHRIGVYETVYIDTHDAMEYVLRCSDNVLCITDKNGSFGKKLDSLSNNHHKFD